jgi:PKD repeat protein
MDLPRYSLLCLLAPFGLGALLCSHPVRAQGEETVSILGTVVDATTAAPILRAKLTVLDLATDEEVAVLFTDAEGQFQSTFSVEAGGEGGHPADYWLGEPFPNPVRAGSRLTFPYTAPPEQLHPPEAEFFDALGRRIPVGASVAPGVYFYRLRFADGSLTRTGKVAVVEATTLQGHPVRASSTPARNLASPGRATAAAEPLLAVLAVERSGYVTQRDTVVLQPLETREFTFRMPLALPPAAHFTLSGALEARGLVHFDATDSTAPEGERVGTYTWDFGDGQRGGGVRIARTFTRPGSYTVVLTVASEHGATATATREVVIGEAVPPETFAGVVRGRVRSTERTYLPGAAVRVLGGEGSAATGLDGTAVLSGIPTGVPVTLEVSLAGYAAQRVLVEIEDPLQEWPFEVTLIQRAAPLTLESAELGGALEGTDGTRVVLPVEGLVHADGAPVTGPVDVNLTPIDVSSRRMLHAFPGVFAGVTPEGPAEVILSHGVAEYVLSQDGDGLQLAPGKHAVIEIPIHIRTGEDGEPLQPGAELPLWSLDETTGVWVQEGMGTVVPSPASPTGLALRGEVSHFSWWNCDVAPVPYRPTPLPINPPALCEREPEEVCEGNSNFQLCVGSVNLFCDFYQDPDDEENDDEEDEWTEDEEDDPYEDFDICERDGLFCDHICQQFPTVCFPSHMEGQVRNPNGPVGEPRRTPLPPGGRPIPLPPNRPVQLTITGNNGTVQGRRTVSGGPGQTGAVLIIMRSVRQAGGGAITCGTQTNGIIDPPGETDTWTFSAQAGTLVDLLVTTHSGSQLQGTVTLVAPSTATVATGTYRPGQPGVPGLASLAETGTYTIRVTDTANAPGRYTLSLACGQTIQIGTEVTSTLVTGLPSFYAFEGVAGQHVNVAALTDQATFSGGLVLRVYDPNGTRVGGNSPATSSYAETGVLTLLHTGPYRVRITDHAGRGSGGFTVGVAEIEEPPDLTLAAPSISVAGGVQVLGDKVFYRFTGQADEVRNLVLTHPPGSRMLAQVRLLRPDGRPFFSRPPIGAASTSAATRLGETNPEILPSDGEYIIEVRSHAGRNRSERTGAYELTIHAPTVQPIAVHTEHQGAIAARGLAVYTFSGVPGQRVLAAILVSRTAGTGGLNARIYEPGGRNAGSMSLTNGYGETGVVTLARAGTYTVVVDGAGAVEADYVLGVAEIQEPQPLALTPPTTVVTGDLQVLGDRQYFRFAGSSGQVRNFILSHPVGSTLNGRLIVRRPGTQAFHALPAMNTVFTTTSIRARATGDLTLPATGDYIIEVRNSFGTTRPLVIGPYSATVELR